MTNEELLYEIVDLLQESKDELQEKIATNKRLHWKKDLDKISMARNKVLSLKNKLNKEKPKVGFPQNVTAGHILDYLRPHFIDCFINHNNEIIIERKNNIYFSISDVNTKFDLDLKVIKWLSRPSYKGLTPALHKLIRTGFSGYFNRVFEVSEIERIYSKLGNGANEKLCIDFLKSNFDVSLLD